MNKKLKKRRKSIIHRMFRLRLRKFDKEYNILNAIEEYKPFTTEDIERLLFWGGFKKSPRFNNQGPTN